MRRIAGGVAALMVLLAGCGGGGGTGGSAGGSEACTTFRSYLQTGWADGSIIDSMAEYRKSPASVDEVGARYLANNYRGPLVLPQGTPDDLAQEMTAFDRSMASLGGDANEMGRAVNVYGAIADKCAAAGVPLAGS